MRETGLPRARLEGERGRTVGQLALFAEVVRDGSWLDARIDPAHAGAQAAAALGPAHAQHRRSARSRCSAPATSRSPSRSPAATPPRRSRPAARWSSRRTRPIPAPPNSSGRAVQAAVKDCGLPEGVFSLLFGVGQLARRGAGRRSAHQGGRLHRLARRRHRADADRRRAARADSGLCRDEQHQSGAPAARGARQRARRRSRKGFVGSLTLGAGQFCTNPGLVLALEGAELDGFVGRPRPRPRGGARRDDAHARHPRGLRGRRGAARRACRRRDARARPGGSGAARRASAALFSTDATSFLPTTRCGRRSSAPRRSSCAARTWTRCGDPRDTWKASSPPRCRWTRPTMTYARASAADARAQGGPHPGQRLSAPASRSRTRWCTAGPFPATSDGRSTSVGTLRSTASCGRSATRTSPRRCCPRRCATAIPRVSRAASTARSRL